MNLNPVYHIKNYFTDRKVVEEISKKYIAEHIERFNKVIMSDLRSVAVIAPPDAEVVERIINLEIAYKEAYMLNSTVASCVNLIADSVSSVPFVLKEKLADGTVVNLDDHPAILLLNDPNSAQTYVDFQKLKVQHIMLCGNSMVYMSNEYATDAVQRMATKAGKAVKELEIFDPDDFDVIAKARRIVKYVVKEKVWKDQPEKYPKREFKADEIIHFMDQPDPKQPYWGIGRIQASYRSIDIDSQIITWWLNTMKNGCRKDALLKFKKDLGEAQYKRIKSQVERQIKGFKEGRGMMILGREHDVEFLNQSPAEMDFSQARKDTSGDVMGIFRVPGILLGRTENSQYGNTGEARKAFWLDNILMICNTICTTYNKFLLVKYPDLKGRKVWLTYDFSKVDAVLQQYMDLVKCAKDMVDIGHSRDEANVYLDMGWGKSPGSNESYINANLISYREREQRMKINQENMEINKRQLEINAQKPRVAASNSGGVNPKKSTTRSVGKRQPKRIRGTDRNNDTI